MSKQVLRRNIFQLERRTNLYEEYKDIDCDLKETKCKANEYSGKTLWKIIGEAMRTWPHRDGDSTISGYLDKRGICFDITEEEAASHEIDILCTLELYLNLLHWAIEWDYRKPDDFSLKLGEIGLSYDIDPIIENITTILERCNYTVRTKKTKDFPQYILTKRNALVDTAIRQIPELADILLSYYDLRNRENEDSKKSILLDLYAYLEPRKSDYKGTPYNDLYIKVFHVFNKFKIRHNDKAQIALQKKQRIELMDMTFDMCVHLLMMPRVAEYKAIVDEYMRKKEQA